MPSSPLYEADPNSLDELFLRLSEGKIKGLPREITNFSLNLRVAQYRKDRKQFVEDQITNLPKPKEKNPNSKSALQARIQRIKEKGLQCKMIQRLKLTNLKGVLDNA